MNLPPVIFFREFDSNGNPLVGGKVYTYQAGTTTPQATYTDSNGITPNTNPIILDSSGRATFWLDPALSYKFVLKDSNDVVLDTKDNVIGLLTANSVNTASLQALCVTTAKMALNSVDSTILKSDASVDANRAVQTNHIRDANVTRGKLASGAVGAQTVVSKTTTYSATSSDDVILVSASSGSWTLTLPAASGMSGRILTIKRTDSTLANQVTIDGNSTETIDGALTKKLTVQYEALRIISDGSNWSSISHQLDQGSAKAWAQVTGSGQTLGVNLNVSSVTDNGVGDATLNFNMPFSTANYSIVFGSVNNGGAQFFPSQSSATAKTASACRVLVVNTSFAAADADIWWFAAFGDQ